MSGGAISGYKYDTERCTEWAQEIKTHSESEYMEYSDSFQQECKWLCGVLKDMADCLFELDRTLSGDSGEERGSKAIDEFRRKWFQGVGPSEGDLVDIGVYAENILTRLNKIRGNSPPPENKLRGG